MLLSPPPNSVVTDLCGDPNAYISNWLGITNPNLVRGDMNHTYFLGTPITGVSGGFHRVCWGYAPVTMFDYKVQIDGTTHLRNPLHRGAIAGGRTKV